MKQSISVVVVATVMGLLAPLAQAQYVLKAGDPSLAGFLLGDVPTRRTMYPMPRVWIWAKSFFSTPACRAMATCLAPPATTLPWAGLTACRLPAA